VMIKTATEDYLPGAVRGVVDGCGLFRHRIEIPPVATNCASQGPWQVVFSKCT
jgi:hypothetical protein